MYVKILRQILSMNLSQMSLPAVKMPFLIIKTLAASLTQFLLFFSG